MELQRLIEWADRHLLFSQREAPDAKQIIQFGTKVYSTASF